MCDGGCYTGTCQEQLQCWIARIAPDKTLCGNPQHASISHSNESEILILNEGLATFRSSQTQFFNFRESFFLIDRISFAYFCRVVSFRLNLSGWSCNSKIVLNMRNQLRFKRRSIYYFYSRSAWSNSKTLIFTPV